jgi:hypothetical protein
VFALVTGSFIGALLMLYAADRLIKARAQFRRLHRMQDRLAAAAASAEKQQEQRQAAAQTSAELTSVLPAIRRPLVSPRRGAAAAVRDEGQGPPPQQRA